MANKLIVFLLLMISFFGCDNKSVNDEYTPKYSNTPPLIDKHIYVLGIYAGENPNRTFEIYQPMVNYINARLKNSEIRIETSKNYQAFNKKLFSGHFDFALANPYATFRAAEKGYRIVGKMGDDDIFKGLVIIRKDSQIHTVNDLRGKIISYPASTALAAAMMPQWYFYTHGLNSDKEVYNIYVGSQESAIMNVYLKKSAAACTWPPPWDNFIKKRPEMAKELMVKWETPSLINNGFVVRNDLPEAIVKEVVTILLNLHICEEGTAILKAQGISKYENADANTYKPVGEFLKKFENEVHPLEEIK